MMFVFEETLHGQLPQCTYTDNLSTLVERYGRNPPGGKESSEVARSRQPETGHDDRISKDGMKTSNECPEGKGRVVCVGQGLQSMGVRKGIVTRG